MSHNFYSQNEFEAISSTKHRPNPKERNLPDLSLLSSQRSCVYKGLCSRTGSLSIMIISCLFQKENVTQMRKKVTKQVNNTLQIRFRPTMVLVLNFQLERQRKSKLHFSLNCKKAVGSSLFYWHWKLVIKRGPGGLRVLKVRDKGWPKTYPGYCLHLRNSPLQPLHYSQQSYCIWEFPCD